MAFLKRNNNDFIIKNGVLKKCKGDDRYIDIPVSVRAIGPSAFSGCPSLCGVTIPSSVKIIDKKAFYRCPALVSITIPDSVVIIGESAFGGCSSLERVIIGSSVTEIGSHAFARCARLREIVIPDSVSSINVGAFKQCTSLISVKLGSLVKNIGLKAFDGCTSLNSVVIPESIQTISSEAFSHCFNTTVYLPRSYKGFMVEKTKFADCKEVVYIDDNAAQPCEADRNIHSDIISHITPDNGAEHSAEPETIDKYVFISYSTKNKEHAESMLHLLKDENINTWMAPYDIPAGSKYAHVINDAIEGCSCVLLLLSEQSQASEWVEREIERAISYKKTVISMHLDACILNSGFKYYISTGQIVPVKVIDKDDENIRKIIDAIRSFMR